MRRIPSLAGAVRVNGGAAKQLVSKRYYEGLRVGEHIPWGAWATPLVTWGALCMLILFAFLCLATMIRAQWSDNERLSFPLAQPALELVRQSEGGTLLANKLLWTGVCDPGFGVWHERPGGVVSRSAEHTSVVCLRGLYFPIPPWNAMGGVRAYLSFAGIGLAFLLPAKSYFRCGSSTCSHSFRE